MVQNSFSKLRTVEEVVTRVLDLQSGNALLPNCVGNQVEELGILLWCIQGIDELPNPGQPFDPDHLLAAVQHLSGQEDLDDHLLYRPLDIIMGVVLVTQLRICQMVTSAPELFEVDQYGAFQARSIIDLLIYHDEYNWLMDLAPENYARPIWPGLISKPEDLKRVMRMYKQRLETFSWLIGSRI